MPDPLAQLTPARPRPRRVTALARRHPLAAVVLILAAAMVALRLGWGWHAGRQRAAYEAAARARGEPVTPADLLAAAPLADDENAWVLVARAGKLDDSSSPSHTGDIYPNYPPFGPLWERAAAASERGNADVFRLVRHARGRDRAQFPVGPLAAPIADALLRHPAEVYTVARTVLDGATLAHLAGDDAEAVERLRDVLHLAALLRQDVWPESHHTADRIDQLAQATAQAIAPGLRPGRPAVRAAVAALVGELLDERAVVDGHRRAAAAERAVADDYRDWQSGRTFALRPLADRADVRAARWFDGLAAAVAATNAADASQALSAAGAHYRLPDGTTAPEYRDMDGSARRYSRWFVAGGRYLDRTVKDHFALLGDRRTTAVCLAAQLYRADHDRWPAKLADLVPGYLPAVPADPFWADGRPLGYVVRASGLPGGGDRPLVYFDPAAPEPDPPVDVEPMYGWQYGGVFLRAWDADLRQFRDLARWAPAERRVDKEMAERAAAEREVADELRVAAEAATRPAGNPAGGPDVAPATQPAGGTPRE
jgi:hypothetical protein